MSRSSKYIYEGVACKHCEHVEKPYLDRATEFLFSMITGFFPNHGISSLISSMGISYSDLLKASVGIDTTQYGKHRAAWIATGDVRELVRMVRHVTLRGVW